MVLEFLLFIECLLGTKSLLVYKGLIVQYPGESILFYFIFDACP